MVTLSSDEQAIRRLKAGDIGGMESLVTCYQVKAARVAFLITHDVQLAEDVVQDTFVRIYQRIQKFDESKTFEPYLMRSVVNAALNLVQQDPRGQTGPDDISDIEEILTHAMTVEDQVSMREVSEELLNAISKLSPRQRVVIIQRYYLEMSEKEMSAALDAAPGTIKWLLNAARNRLRSLLGLERSAK
jgi:RNA polymerase sigma-70 factor (ECF subfamily)